ncbi:MAG: trypsin-like peptidase domain-containing protein [Bacteroidota bacterium]
MKYFQSIVLLFFAITLKAQDLSEVYEKVNDAVVVIFTEKEALINTGSSFKKMSSAGLGSGFLISEKQIITAGHVVDVAETIMVQFVDGEIIPAKVISNFKTSDIALIELNWAKKNATTVKLGNSDNVKIGERIFVVGAPYGLDHSLSAGYVSGVIKKRKGENPFTQAEFIQTDAAINKGNSGGPMFNLNGEVIGVVSNILSVSGGFQGIGFAATSNIVQELLLNNHVFWSGMDATPLTGKLARIFNVPQPDGLLVQRVVLLSPMGLLGLEGGDTKVKINDQELIIGGDIILAINGIKFEMNDDTLSKIAKNTASTKPDDPYKLTVLRGGKVITLERK